MVRGEVAIAGRSGGDRLWDLAERVYPDDPVVPADEALRIRNERRLRVHAIHQDDPFTKTMTAAIGREIEGLAHWLEPALALPD